MTRASGRETGTTLVELLIATCVTLVALATVVALVVPWASGTHTIGEAADLQQRMRVAAAVLTRAIHGAGRGAVVGQGVRRPRPWPAVLPCRWLPGQPMCQPVTDAITVLGMDDGLQVLLAEDMPGPSAPLVVTLPSGCPAGASACRLVAGTAAVIVDASGSRDEFVVTGVSADGTLLTHTPATLSRAYRAGAVIGRSTAEAFYARADAGSGALHLRSSRGEGDFPLLDGLTAIEFEYLGDARPPAVLARSATRIVVSYGPEPPPVGEDDDSDPWPAGENCTFAATADDHLPRLPVLPVTDDGLARLAPGWLADGPWCPDAASAWRFDADLLRVRRVRITLRFQAQSATVRGTDARWFSRPGTARTAVGLVPDMEGRIDVALRNAR